MYENVFISNSGAYSILQVNDRFGETAELRLVAKRYFVPDGGMVRADGRVSGSKSILYRCSRASFDVKANNYLRKVTEGYPALIGTCNK